MSIRLHCVLASGALVLLAACGTDAPSAAPAPSQLPSAVSTASPAVSTASAAAAPTRSLVMLGDSWPKGSHCNGCTPFPDLYAKALDSDQPTGFTNLTEDGATSDSLLSQLRLDPDYRSAVQDADVIVISIGANDMEPAFKSWTRHRCGRPAGLGCFRRVADAWGRNMDAILSQIDTLRAGRPTAVRVLDISNEFLSDPGLLAMFGPKFARHQGAEIVAWQKQEFCRAAARHHDQCVDLRPVLNGPHLDKPQDVNTQDAMQAVANALQASGLPELRG